jgi:hypothetical protein
MGDVTAADHVEHARPEGEVAVEAAEFLSERHLRNERGGLGVVVASCGDAGCRLVERGAVAHRSPQGVVRPPGPYAP